MDNKMWWFSQYYSALRGIKKNMEVVLKRIQRHGNQVSHNFFQTQMNKFNYFFGVKLAILLLRHSDNLSATLQSPKLYASQAQSIA